MKNFSLDVHQSSAYALLTTSLIFVPTIVWMYAYSDESGLAFMLLSFGAVVVGFPFFGILALMRLTASVLLKNGKKTIAETLDFIIIMLCIVAMIATIVYMGLPE